MIVEAATQFRHAQSRYSTRMEQIILDGQKLLRNAAERTQGYQKSSTYVPTTTLLSAVGTAASGGLVGSSTPMGLDSTGPGGTADSPSWRRRQARLNARSLWSDAAADRFEDRLFDEVEQEDRRFAADLRQLDAAFDAAKKLL
jgi:outer membrane protein TolC